MSKNDYALNVTFRIDAGNLSHFHVSEVIDRVMASVGFHTYRSPAGLFDLPTSQQSAEINSHYHEVGELLKRTDLPTAAYGWPIKAAAWWPVRELCDPSPLVLWSSPAEFGGWYMLHAGSIGLFQDLVAAGYEVYDDEITENDGSPWLDVERSPSMDVEQDFLFGKGRVGGYGDYAPGLLYLETHVLPFNCASRSGLDRFWTLVLRDVVAQLHYALPSVETTFLRGTDNTLYHAKFQALDFWPPGWFKFEPSGDAKVDAVLDAYEQELRDDPMRLKVLSQDV
jgi:hypothetical protein